MHKGNANMAYHKKVLKMHSAHAPIGNFSHDQSLAECTKQTEIWLIIKKCSKCTAHMHLSSKWGRHDISAPNQTNRLHALFNLPVKLSSQICISWHKAMVKIMEPIIFHNKIKHVDGFDFQRRSLRTLFIRSFFNVDLRTLLTIFFANLTSQNLAPIWLPHCPAWRCTISLMLN